MTGGQIVIEALKHRGVDTVFGIPGMHSLPVYDALVDEPGIRHVLARHEQGATFMANGYARASARPGVALTTTGPAACNAMAALADAYRDSVPVLVISSQIHSDFIGQDRGMFHEMNDQLGMARGAAGWARRVESPDEIAHVLAQAWDAMTAGRPRPAYVEIPENLLASEAAGDVDCAPPARPSPDPAVVAEAARRLERAERPLIYAGGGVDAARAGTHLTRLAETLGSPVAMTCNGRGSIPDDHPLALGCVRFTHRPYRDLWTEADVVLAAGTDLDEFETGRWQLPAPRTLLRVDIDPDQTTRNYSPTVALAGDAGQVLRALADQLPAGRRTGTMPWAAGVAAVRDRVREQVAGQDGRRLVQAMRDALGRGGITTGDAAGVGIWQVLHMPVYEPGTFLFPLGFGTLGFGLPAAIGAQAAFPERRVVCLCGDGGFLFNAQELATAVQHELNVVTIVVNDSGFGSIRSLQRRRYGNRVIAADLVNPDFVRLAESFGAFGRRADGVAELPAALAAAFASGKPGVIELPGPIESPRG